MDELIERAAADLISSKHAIALTGAGISTESGIHDFRGPDGIWTKHPEAEMEAYEAYGKLVRDPKHHWEKMLEPGSFYRLFEEIGNADPNPGHFALAELEKLGILKAVITQNVDGLHQKAGSRNVLEYHGGVAKLRCMSCGSRYPKSEYDLEKLYRDGQLPPRCRKCNGVLKGDGVYFGEAIPADVAEASVEEALSCDVMLICGTSAVVYPFAELPRIARNKRAYSRRWGGLGPPAGETPTNVTIIEVNADPTPLTHERVSNYFIQGKTGQILPRIVEEVKKKRS
ncbi:MAG: NAD-dependent deacylase [Dehalococcoidia bacterium]|nr:NAD-dependent deacylase [Dehalococcoidia bacterium]